MKFVIIIEFNILSNATIRYYVSSPLLTDGLTIHSHRIILGMVQTKSEPSAGLVIHWHQCIYSRLM